MVKILYQGSPGQLKALHNAFNSENVEIDNRNLDNINPGSAGILTDYDILAFDLASPIYIHPKYYPKLRAFLNEKHGILLFILRQMTTMNVTPPGQSEIQTNNHELLFSIFKFTDNNINDLRFDKSPSYGLIPSRYGKNSIIKGYFEGDAYNIHIVVPKEKELSIHSLAIDNENNTVAFSIKPYTSQVFVVPPKRGNELIELIEYAIPMIGKSAVNLNNVPEWVYTYATPGLEEISNKIKIADEKIENLDRQREKNKKEQRKLENIRNALLFGKHDILHETVFSVLNEMGLRSKMGPKGGLDIEFSSNNNEFVCEVKGRDKSIDKKDMLQLIGWKDQAESDKETKVKGLLIANPWRKLPLEERDTNDKPNFPDSLNKLVELKELCLVTTAQIFAIYCQWRQNKKSIDIKKIIDEMHSIIGFYSKFTDLKKVEKAIKE